MMSSCMTKLEFLTEPYMLLRLGKLPHICCLLLQWVLSSFVDPYERFVMFLKSRSHTHHPNMHYSYTGGRRKKHAFHLDPPKIFYSYTGGKHKNMLVRFSLKINAPSSCWYICQSFIPKKRHGPMQKLFIRNEKREEEEEKSSEKMGRYPRYLKQWVLRCPPKKEKKINKIAPIL